MKVKRLVSWILAIVILLVDVSYVNAENLSDEIQQDIYGQVISEVDIAIDEAVNETVSIISSGDMDGVLWSITTDGLLTISGTNTSDNVKTSMEGAPWFEYRESITKVKVTAKNVKNTCYWFSNCSNITEFDFSEFDTSQVENMVGMFTLCESVTALDLSSFDTSKVTTMMGMFSGCERLTSLNISSFNTSNVTNMQVMFASCTSMETLDLSNINTSKVTNMGSMFAACNNLKDLDVSGFDTANVTKMSYMFNDCNALTSLDLSSFDGSSLKEATMMFRNCTSLEKLSAFSNVSISIDLPSLPMYDEAGNEYTTLPQNLEEAFWLYAKEPAVISSGDLSGIKWKVFEDGTLILSGTNVDNSGQVLETYPWHEYADAITATKVTTQNVITTANWFKNCSKLESVDFSYFDSSTVTKMNNMFMNCSSLPTVDLSNLDINNVENISGMFYGCTKLNNLHMGEFATGKVYDMSEVFRGCEGLEKLDVSKFDTSNVETMEFMFSGCKSLQTLEVINFDTSKVKSMQGMFSGCSSLTKLDISSFDTSALEAADRVTDMFFECGGITKFVPCKNLTFEQVELPVSPMYDRYGNSYTYCPIGLTENITLYAADPALGVAEGLWVTQVQPQVYTGSAIKPAIEVRYNDTPLIEKTDYTISYKNNVKANDASDVKTAPTITVKGKGNYTGTENITFQILAKDLAETDVAVKEMVAVAGNKVQKPVPTLTYNGKKLKNKKDFTVSYPDLDNPEIIDAYKAPGTYTVRVEGMGNFKGTRDIIFTITGGTLMSKVKIASIPNQPYTGADIEPEVKVTYKGKTLVKNIDYTVDYKNNVKVGKATVIVTGVGSYAGTKEATFTITGISIAKAKVNGIINKVYNGTEQVQNLEVVLGEEVLQPSNYTVTYAKNVNVGTATVAITGTGNYTGTVKKSFKITAYDLQADADKLVSGIEEDLTVAYTKGGSMPAPDLSFNGTKLVDKKDYTISYVNNKKVASASDKKAPAIKIKGKGNFKGTITVPFNIVEKDLKSIGIAINVQDVAFSAKAGKYISKPVLTDVNGKKLVSGTDYEKAVVYTLEDGTVLDGKKDAPEVGTVIKVTVNGKGCYTGTTEATYVITVASFKSAKITIGAQEYTGSAITLNAEDITVKMGKETLTYGVDYVIVEDSYKNNVKKGTASVTIKGIGNYGGEKTVKFKIGSKKFIWFWDLF